MNHWVSSQIVARSFWFSTTEQQWLKILAKFYVLRAGKFHCHLWSDSINLFEFHIVMQFHFLGAQFLPEMVVDAFTVPHLRHRLTT
jgi:hypothetical protein